MGIRLSRNLQEKVESNQLEEQNLNIVVTPGEDYNLDEISENRNRQSRISSLVLENVELSTQGISANGEDGELSIESESRGIPKSTNQIDYATYLLQDNDNRFFPPLKYPKRQIVDWEEGTEDNSCEEGSGKDSLYYDFYNRMLDYMAEDPTFMALLLEKFHEMNSKIDVVETDKPDHLAKPIITTLYDESEALESNRILKHQVDDNRFEFMVPFFADYLINNIEGQMNELVHKE